MCRALEGFAVWFVWLHDQVGTPGVVSSHPDIPTSAKIFGEVCRPAMIGAALGLSWMGGTVEHPSVVCAFCLPSHVP